MEEMTTREFPMIDARKFIFPAIFLASLAIFFLTKALYAPQPIVLADTLDQPEDLPT
jgi:hypothetical protein